MRASRPWASRACAATQGRPASPTPPPPRRPAAARPRAARRRRPRPGRPGVRISHVTAGSATRRARATASSVSRRIPSMSPVTMSRPSRPVSARQRASVGRSGPDPVEPRQPLAGVATQREVEPDAARELGGIPVAVELEQPQVGRAQVGVVGLEPVERDGETRALEGISERRRAGVEVCGVPVGGRGGEPGLVQALHRELPHRLEQPEPRLVVRSTAPAARATGRRARRGRAGRRRRHRRRDGPRRRRARTRR